MRRVMLVALVLAASSSVLVGDERDPFTMARLEGHRVRVYSTEYPSWIEGVMANVGSHDLTVQIGKRQKTVSLASVRRLDRAVDRRRHPWQGLVIGAAGGLMLGMGGPVDRNDCGANSINACSRRGAVATTGLGGALVGLGIGALVQTDRWSPVLDTHAEGSREPPLRRDGYVVGFSLGVGGFNRSDGTVSDRQPGTTFTYHTGRMVGPRAAWLLDGSSIETSVDGATVTNALVGPAIQYWPARRVWLRGGLGLGGHHVEVQRGGSAASIGFGYTAAAGVELLQKGQRVVDVQARYWSLVEVDDYAKPTGVNTGNLSVSIGLNWY